MENVRALEQTLRDIAQVNPSTGALEISVDNLRKARQFFDSIAARAGRYEGKALADYSMAESHAMAADAIREQFAKSFPSIDQINKEFSFWKNVHRVVSDTVLRRQGQAKPLGRKIAGAAGAAVGGATGGLEGFAIGKAAADALEALMTSPAWGTSSAVFKDRLAKALAAGSRGEAEFYITKLVRAAATARAAHRDERDANPDLESALPGTPR
jgi:hypothetical protein